MEYNYNIVLKDNKNFILASCKTMELAQTYLEDIKKTDKELQKSYKWTKLPEYEIIERVEEGKNEKIEL